MRVRIWILLPLVCLGCGLVSQDPDPLPLSGKYRFTDSVGSATDVSIFKDDSVSLTVSVADSAGPCIIAEGTRRWRLKEDSICFFGGRSKTRLNCREPLVDYESSQQNCRRIRILGDTAYILYFQPPGSSPPDNEFLFRKIE